GGLFAGDDRGNRGPAGENRWQVGARRRVGGVVLRNHPAQRDARATIDQPQHDRQYRTPHVLEVHVDAGGTGRAECRDEIVRLVVDARVETKSVDRVTALFGRTGDADRPAVPDFRELTDDRAHRARRRRYHDGFTRLWLPDVDEPDVRRQPRHAEHADCGGRRQAGIDFADVLTCRARVLLPAVVAGDKVSGLKRRVPRFDDLAHRVADHHGTQAHGRRIRTR